VRPARGIVASPLGARRADRTVAVWWYDLIFDCLAELGFEPPADTFRSERERPPACDWERTDALDVARLWLLAEAGLEDPAVGVRAGACASDYTASRHCPVLRLTMAQPTPRAGIETLVRFQLLISDSVDLDFEPGPRGSSLFRAGSVAVPDLPAAQAVLRHQIDFGLAMMFRMATFAVRHRSVVREVQLRHRPAAPWVDAYEAAFDCPIRFGAEDNALVFDDALLDERSGLADAEVAKLLEARAERTVASLAVQPWSSRVCRQLSEKRTSLPSLEEVASSLAVSPRTLQRRLAEENTSFQALFRRVGLELAEQQAGLQPAERVAERLGYSDARAFERAFQRWTGVTFATYVAHTDPLGSATA